MMTDSTVPFKCKNNRLLNCFHHFQCFVVKLDIHMCVGCPLPESGVGRLDMENLHVTASRVC